MKPNRTALLLALAGAFGFSSQALADPRISDLSSGYEIPAYGQNIEIIDSFAAADGHLVLEFWFRDAGVLKGDFFDTQKNDRLFKNQETAIPENEALRASLAKKAGLTKIPSSLYKMPMADGVMLHNGYSDEPTCHWPYAKSLKLDVPDSAPIEHTVVMPLAEPLTRNFERDCEMANGTVALTIKYRDIGSTFFADGEGGFWAIIAQSPYAIHFDGHGKSGFFDGRKDIVLVPSKELNRLHNDADNSPQSQQYFIDQEEMIMHKALHDQSDSND